MRVARVALLPGADAGRAFHVARKVELHPAADCLAQRVACFGKAGGGGHVVRIDAQRAAIQRNRVGEQVGGKVHVAELRDRDVVAGMRGDPLRAGSQLLDDRGRRPAFDALLRPLLPLSRAVRPRSGLGRLSEDRTGDAESCHQQIAP